MSNTSDIKNNNYLKDSSISISLDNVSISYGESVAVKNVFCDVKKIK